MSQAAYTMLKLPAQRGAQLKALAKARDVTMTELIGEWINREIQWGKLPDTLPGIEIKSARGKVNFAIEDNAFKSMLPDVAIDAASTWRTSPTSPLCIWIWIAGSSSNVLVLRC